MADLMKASKELFKRSPDERYSSLVSLWEYCNKQKAEASAVWHPPTELSVLPGDSVSLKAGSDGAFLMNDWSYSQLCRLANVSKDTANRLSPNTASQVFRELMPGGSKPLQLLTEGTTVRSIHGSQYTRLWNADLLMMLREFAVDFEPPQEGFNGATGLYAGEQDMFAFLIDPAGWTEINGENFAPGFFVWNSEVGRRSLGIQTFWFQAVCQNHIVWDAIEVVEWKRKHTARVSEGLPEIRTIIEHLVKKRDERKDGFAKVVAKAMTERIGDLDESLKALCKQGITRSLAKAALDIAKERGAFTIWSVVDALTKISQKSNAGDRTEADEKASKLLSLV